MDGLARIAAERQRQLEKEGWTPQHDNEHTKGEMALAAALYASPEPLFYPMEHEGGAIEFVDPWPWDREWDKRKKHNRIRQLEIAGALIAAELDRLCRVTAEPDDRKAGEGRR